MGVFTPFGNDDFSVRWVGWPLFLEGGAGLIVAIAGLELIV